MYRFSIKVKTVSGAETVVAVDANDCKSAIAVATTHPQIAKNYADAYSFEVDLTIPTVTIPSNTSTTVPLTSNANETSTRAGVSISL